MCVVNVPSFFFFLFEHILLYKYMYDTYTNGLDTNSDNLLGRYHFFCSYIIFFHSLFVQSVKRSASLELEINRGVYNSYLD